MTTHAWRFVPGESGGPTRHGGTELDKKRRLAVVGLAGALFVGAAVAPAAAEDAPQVVTASIADVLTLAPPTAAVNFGALNLSAANNASGGSIGVTFNVPYSVKVKTDQATMAEWDGSAYVASGKTLASPLALTAAAAVGSTATAVASPATTSSAIKTFQDANAGAGLLLATNPLGLAAVGGTDTYDLSLSQPATIADQAGTYRMQLTYTLSQGI